MSKANNIAPLADHNGRNSRRRVRRIVPCAFCQGKGIDPFDFLAPLSKCLVCLGKGKVEIVEPSKECAYCEGTGIQPFGAMLMCTVCEGKGVVSIKEPNKVCPKCRGNGRSQENGVPCLMCKGKGVVAKKTIWRER